MSAEAQLGPAVSVGALEELARERLEPAVFDYVAGGAGDERTLVENGAAFARRTLRPRVLRGVDVVDVRTSVLGAPVSSPVLVAPVSLQRLVCPDGEVASARAAAAAGTIFCLSMFASRAAEDVAEAAPGLRRWQQVYLVRDRDVVLSVVRRAESAGFEALVVTVDVPLVGRRERDVRNGFSRFAAGDPGLLRDPAFVRRVERAGGAALDELDAIFPNPAAGWEDFEWLLEQTRLPVLVKGVLRADDARRAVDAGAAGIVVSNHGGRQSDRVPASVDALPHVAAEVGEDVPVLLDSGVRRGTDVLIALACGATAVLIGRPVVWGLAAAGEAGVRHALDALARELALAMALAGAASVEEVDASLLAPPLAAEVHR